MSPTIHRQLRNFSSECRTKRWKIFPHQKVSLIKNPFRALILQKKTQHYHYNQQHGNMTGKLQKFDEVNLFSL